MLKTCSKCEKDRPLEEFYRLSSSKDGRRPDCKECCKKGKKKFEQENPVRDRTNRMATGILQRTTHEVDKPENKCYKDHNVKSKIGNNWKEISDFLYNNHYDEIRALIEKGKIPSVDRIDSKKDYSPDNIRIIDLHDNVLMGVANAIKETSRPIKAIKAGVVTEYSSIKAAAKDLNMKRDTIYAHLDKDTTCRKGYQFETIF